ncbi:hypothetical protein ABZS29_35100 [Kribbella sp. NPDC005582]|uniref:hypothetical protein n=1 Tax=Kribbella sp. NPDC005582 TaxID=3156893 RepID=UPI0033AA65D7
MRKFALAAAAVAALTAGLQAPAWAAAPDVPTGVTIAWADSSNIKLTWTDTGEANTVYWQLPGGNELKFGDVASTAANEFLFPASVLAKNLDKVKLIVKSTNADGESASAPSPEFDTFVPAAPALQDATLAANLSTQLKWTLPATSDATPGDPLDARGYEGIEVTALRPNGTTQSLGVYSFATDGATIAPQPRPTTFTLTSISPWGKAKGARTVKLGTLGAGITVPASAQFSNRLPIKSTLDLFTSPGREERASGIKVELQARAKTTDAFKTYGRYDGNTTAAFDTGIAALGNRQYRLWVPARKVATSNVIVLTPATSTSVKSSKTYVKFGTGGFSPSVVRVGARSTFSVKILPAVSVKAQLQGWTGSKWIALGDLPLTKGSYVERGDIETERYTVRVRVIAPTVVVNGLTVLANTSPAYNLTVK